MEGSTEMIKNFNGRLLSQQQQQPMETCISFPPKTSLRNAPFSSYLRPNNQADDLSEISIFDSQKYFNESNNNIDSKVITSNRVSPVNVIINNPEQISEHRISSDVSALPRFSSSSSVDGDGRNYYRTRSFTATPTVSSEASWNSRTGLLLNPHGTVAVSMRNPATEEKKRGTSSKWQLFGLKCPCFGKKSVQVEEKISEPKTLVARSYNKKQVQKSLEIPVEKNFPNEEIVSNSRRISAENRFTDLSQRVSASGRPYDATTGFTFPILNQTSSMKLVLNNLSSSKNNTTPLEEPPRESLEIFQPPSEELQDGVLDVSRQSFTFPVSPCRTRMTSITDDDVASDASSDLFEIESFSTQTITSYPMYNHRGESPHDDANLNVNSRRLAATDGSNLICCIGRSLDEPVLTPSVPAATDQGYKPSEASIDWSVTTAEGFDRGSVANFSVTQSEVDDVAVIRHEYTGGGGRKKGNGGGGTLLSCRSEKVVSVVGPNPGNCVAGSGMRHVSSRPCNANTNKPPLARSP